MTSNSKLPNYKDEFFEYKTLTKIHGRPTIEKLLGLYREVKLNAQSVHTTLGGGQHGYLGLVLDPITYGTIPHSAPFVRPTDPGIFRVVTPVAPTVRVTRTGVRAAPAAVAGPTAAEIATQQAQHDERKRLYNECQAVELALRNQIVEAIDPIYLKPLRNSATHRLTARIPAIFSFLQTTYGKVSDPQLLQKEANVTAYTYDPRDPPDMAFNNVDDYADLCDLILRPVSDRKKLQLVYCIFQKTGAFTDSLKDWNSKPIADKTYDNFRIFMRTEHSELEDVGALSMANSSLNQANLVKHLQEHEDAIATRLEAQMKANFVEALATFGQMEQSPDLASSFDLSSFDSNSNSSQSQNEYPSQQSINSVATDKMMERLLKSFQELQTKVDGMCKTTNTTGNKNNKLPTINPRTGQPYKRYCWSCGCCDHWGRQCPRKKRGHQDDATFKDRKGGSSQGVLGA